MLKLKQIFYESLLSTSRFPRWWILALVQLVGLSLVGEFSRPGRVGTVLIFWLFCGVIFLVLATSLLWMEIRLNKEKKEFSIGAKNFIVKCNASAVVVFASVILVIAVRLMSTLWVFLAFFSSVIAATATLVMLYAVLCQEPFYKALALALDTWNRKFSLAAIVAFLLILAHGVSFALVHGFFTGFRGMHGFSVFSHSATIWVLFLALISLIAFVSAVLNSFLVLLFLESIRQKKDPEVAKNPLPQLAISDAGF